MPQWLTSKVLERKVWSEGLFTITVDGSGVEPFLPGQFVQLGCFPSGHDGDRDQLINRPYSIASPHGDRIDFFIVRVDGGELTPMLWDLNVGDTLQVSRKGTGSFTLKKTPDAENLWLIATGTGLAPYIAMLRTAEPWERYKEIVLVHGVRMATDLAYTEELQSFKLQYGDRFSFIQSLTRDSASGALNGRIPELASSGRLEAAAGCSLTKESAVMLCGNPAMLDSMEEMLAQRQMTLHKRKEPGQIVLERYW